MTKIIYLYESLGIGGAEQLLLTTLKYLDSHRFSPLVYCIANKGEIGREIEEQMGIPVVSLNSRCRLWNIRVIFDLFRILLKEKPDILHTHLFYANYFGRIAAIFARINVVVITEHGTYSNFKKFYHHWIDFLLSFSTSRIISVSNAVKKYILKHTLISPGKIFVLYNSVDTDRFDAIYGIDKQVIRKRLGFVGSDFVIGYVSNLAPWKGQLSLIKAFAQNSNVIPNAKLCIVGRDLNGFKNRLENFARERGVLEKVYFLNECRNIPEILRALDIFVFASLTEGLGISLLEAMYMGLPAVASNREGILEIIEDNKDGILVDPRDTLALAAELVTLSRDSERMKRIGASARQKIKRSFSPRVYIEKLESFYDELIKA